MWAAAVTHVTCGCWVGGLPSCFFSCPWTLLGLIPQFRLIFIWQGSCVHLAAGHLTSLPWRKQYPHLPASSQPLGYETIWITCSPAPSLCPCSSGAHTCLCTLGHPDWAVRGSGKVLGVGQKGTASPPACPFGPSHLLGMESGQLWSGGCIPGQSRILRWVVSLEGVYRWDCGPSMTALMQCQFWGAGLLQMRPSSREAPGRRGCSGPATSASELAGL